MSLNPGHLFDNRRSLFTIVVCPIKVSVCHLYVISLWMLPKVVVDESYNFYFLYIGINPSDKYLFQSAWVYYLTCPIFLSAEWARPKRHRQTVESILKTVSWDYDIIKKARYVVTWFFFYCCYVFFMIWLCPELSHPVRRKTVTERRLPLTPAVIKHTCLEPDPPESTLSNLGSFYFILFYVWTDQLINTCSWINIPPQKKNPQKKSFP